MPEIIVYKWRIFCYTENDWAYTWSENEPTTCPNDTSHSVNTQSLQIVDELKSTDVKIKNISQTPFLDNIVVEKTPIIDLKSFYPISNLNDFTQGNVSSDGTEIILSSTTENTSIRSVKTGIYVSGTICECGIAIRIPGPLVGNQILKFGYFNSSDGFYFKVTSSGLSCCIMNGGIELEIPRQDFNTHKLDGTEASEIDLDLSKGNIFQIRFSWYGYGAVQFGVISKGKDNIQQVFAFHRYFTEGHTSTKNPNLPINTVLENNGELTETSVFLAGRQFSIYGKIPVIVRENSFYIRNQSIVGSFNPIFSLKRKEIYRNCKITLVELILNSNVDAVVQVICEANLSGSNYNDNPYATETAIEIDTSANSYSSGIIVYNTMIFEGERRITNIDIDICGSVTIVARRLQDTLSDDNVSIIARYKENW